MSDPSLDPTGAGRQQTDDAAIKIEEPDQCAVVVDDETLVKLEPLDPDCTETSHNVYDSLLTVTKHDVCSETPEVELQSLHHVDSPATTPESNSISASCQIPLGGGVRQPLVMIGLDEIKAQLELHTKRRCLESPSPPSGEEMERNGQQLTCSLPASFTEPDIDYSACTVNYGSEPESDESDDEELMTPRITRTVRALMETPVDPETASRAATDSVSRGSLSSCNDFQWKPFDNPPVPPESRREKFSDSDVGPTNPYTDPYESFTAIWDRRIMECIVSETNRYAKEVHRQISTKGVHHRKRYEAWSETTVGELYIYFAILLAMAVVVKSRVEEYWHTCPDIFYTPGFSAHMSRRRFMSLSKCLHFSDNKKMHLLQLDVAEAKLFKIQPVVEHLNNKFQELYTPSQNVAIDESLLQWEGQLDSNKANATGIRAYELYETHTGYLWRFVIVRELQCPEEFTPGIVLGLVRGLEKKGHTLFMDSFFNSPALARRLKASGFDCAGTLRTNRQHVPESLRYLGKEDMVQDQIAGLTAGDVDVIVWRGEHRVAMISTYHGDAVYHEDGPSRPTLIHDYNHNMSGLDKKDRALAMHPVERQQTKVWYKKLFRRLINATAFNAYILCKNNYSNDYRTFRRTLIKSITEKHSHSNIKPVSQTVAYDVKYHHLSEYPFLLDKRSRRRRLCMVCKKRATTYCVGCETPVCIYPCFVDLHYG